MFAEVFPLPFAQLVSMVAVTTQMASLLELVKVPPRKWDAWAMLPKLNSRTKVISIFFIVFSQYIFEHEFFNYRR